VVSLLLVFSSCDSNSVVKAAALLSAGVSMGAGAIGPGLGIGFVGARAAFSVGANMPSRAQVNRTLLLGAAVAESTSIYAFVIAVLLMYVT